MTGLWKSRWQIAICLLVVLVAVRRGWCQQDFLRRLPPVNPASVGSVPPQQERGDSFFQVSAPVNSAVASSGWQPSSPNVSNTHSVVQPSRPMDVPTTPRYVSPQNSFGTAWQRDGAKLPYSAGNQFSPTDQYSPGNQYPPNGPAFSYPTPQQQSPFTSGSTTDAQLAYPEFGGSAMPEECCQPPVWIKPCFEFYLGFLYLDQSAATSAIPLVIECECLDGIFRPNTVDYDWREGVRATVIGRWPKGCSPCACCDFEMTYFGVSKSWDQNGFEGDMLVLNQDVFAGMACVCYTSRLSSLELNCRHCAGPWKEWIFGVRWIELVERAGVTGIDWTGTAIVSESRDVYNGMLGLQAGIERCIWDKGGLFTATAYAKGGLYNNHVSLQSVGAQTYSGTANDLAFVGDFQVMGKYQLTRCFSLNAGYQFLWLSGVGLGLDQFYNAVNTINRHDNVLFHGLNIGLEFRW